MEAAEIDTELTELDEKIDKLRALYEQYFMGIERLEPQKPRQDVERRLKVLRREQIRNTAQRFKFNVLVQRFNTMSQYWGRVVREIENGTFKRDVLRAAARFGDTALTAAGKKRAKELERALAAQTALQGKRPVDDAWELAEDDLIEDDDEAAEVDEAPTPPKALPSSAGLAPGDLPLVAGPHVPPQPDLTQHHQHVYAQQPQYAQPQYAQPQYEQQPQYAQPQYEQQPQYAQPQYEQQPQYAQHYQQPYAQPQYAEPQHQQPPVAEAPVPPAQLPAASPSGSGRAAGLRWGSSDPSSSIRTAPTDVRRRVSELAAEMRAPTKVEGNPGGFGSLDLDFDDAPSAQRSSDPGTPPPRSSGAGRPPQPGAAGLRGGTLPMPSKPNLSGMRAPTQPGAAVPPAPSSGFGVLDLALDGPPAPQAPAPAASSPGSGIRTGNPRPVNQASLRGSTAPTPPVQRPAPAASPPAAGGDLAEQRMRQIYAKYVETKRASNESTAGVTYEKLAATLRAQTEKLKSSHPSKSVDFEVVVKDGKTHLKPVLR